MMNVLLDLLESSNQPQVSASAQSHVTSLTIQEQHLKGNWVMHYLPVAYLQGRKALVFCNTKPVSTRHRGLAQEVSQGPGILRCQIGICSTPGSLQISSTTTPCPWEVSQGPGILQRQTGVCSTPGSLLNLSTRKGYLLDAKGLTYPPYNAPALKMSTQIEKDH